jgi:hypothetical protein
MNLVTESNEGIFKLSLLVFKALLLISIKLFNDADPSEDATEKH